MADQPSQTTFAKDQLKSIIERVEKLEEEKKQIADDIREVYAEAKGNGFDVTALRAIVRMRKMDADERREQESVLEVYMHALGMLSDLPLGMAAIEREFKDTKVTISVPGSDLPPVETTSGDIARAAAHLRTRKGKSDLRRIVHAETERVQSEAKNGGNNPGGSSPPPSGSPPPPATGSPPPACASASGVDDLDIPTFLRRGHPDCSATAPVYRQ